MTTSDWRLKQHNVGLERQARKQADEEAACRARFPADVWQMLATSASENALAVAAGRALEKTATPEGLDSVLTQAWESVAGALSGSGALTENPSQQKSPAQRCLAVDVVVQLAQKGSGTPALWRPIVDLAEQLLPQRGWWLFMNSLDVEAIRANEGALNEFPPLDDPSQNIDTFNHLREPTQWNAFIHDLRAREAVSSDQWELIAETARRGRDVELSEDLFLKSSLAQRAGTRFWVRWLSHLALLPLVESAIGRLDSLDEAAELLKSVLSEGLDDRTRTRLAIIVVRHTKELFERVWRNLANGADARWTMPGDGPEWRLKCESAFAEWKDRELDERAAGLARTLAEGGEAGKETGRLAVRHIFSAIGNDHQRNYGGPVATSRAIRMALLEYLPRVWESREKFLADILGETPTNGGLLSAARLLVETTTATRQERVKMASRVLVAYQSWLQVDRLWWQVPLTDEAQELAFCIAASLAELDHPNQEFSRLMGAVAVPSEGWDFESKPFYEAISGVSHLFTVGAMCAEWLIRRERQDDAIVTFDLVWTAFHEWLRGLSTATMVAERVTVPLSNLWARLPLLHRGADMTVRALQALQEIDELDWTVIAARSLKANLPGGGPRDLAPVLQLEVQHRFNQLFPLMKRRTGIKQEVLEDFRAQERELVTSTSTAL